MHRLVRHQAEVVVRGVAGLARASLASSTCRCPHPACIGSLRSIQAVYFEELDELALRLTEIETREEARNAKLLYNF